MSNQIKPLPSTPLVGANVDNPTFKQIQDILITTNQIIKQVNAPVSTDVPAHKANHATGGSDALTPGDIGAATSTHNHDATYAAIGHVGAALGTGVHPIPSGSVVQVVTTQTGEMQNGTTLIPLDDTIPQNTEGTEFLTVSITPKSATNILIIDVYAVIGTSVIAWVASALFKDSGASAIAAFADCSSSANGSSNIAYRYKIVAGSTAATTFRVRFGPDRSATITLNGYGGARKLGGVMASSITVTEVQA